MALWVECMAKTTDELALEFRSKAGECWANSEIAQGLVFIEQSLKLNPNDPVANNCKGMLLADSNTPDAAFPAYEHALELAVAQDDDLNQFKIMRNWSVALIDQYRPQEALPLALKVIKSPHAVSVNHSNLACLYLDLHDYDLAFASLQTALEMDQLNLLAMQLKADYYCAIGKFRKAAETMAELSSIITEDPDAIGTLRPKSQAYIKDSLAERLELMDAFCSTIEDASVEVDDVVVEAGATTDNPVTPATIMNALCGNQDMATAQSMLDTFMESIKAQVKANAEAIAKAAADAEIAALEAARATATAGAAGAAAAHLQEVALTVTNSPALVKAQTDAEIRAGQKKIVEGNDLLREYQDAFYYFIDTTVSSVFSAAGPYVSAATPGGIPFASTVASVLPPIAQQCVQALDLVVASYRGIKQHNEIHDFASVFSKVDDFKLIAKEAGRFMAVTYAKDICAANVSRTGLLGFWDKAQDMKAKVIANPFDTPVKQLAMQHASMMCSGLCQGVFNFDTPMGEQLLICLSEDVVQKNLAEELARSQDNTAVSHNSSKKCTIMCVKDIVYDNPLLNDDALIKWLAQHGKLSAALDISADSDSVESLAFLVSEDGIDGFDAWQMSLLVGRDADFDTEF